MADPTLKQLLDELHDKLAASPRLSDDDRSALQQLSGDIQGRLGSPEQHAGILARLNELAASAEGSHPELAVTILKIVQALSDMGI